VCVFWQLLLISHPLQRSLRSQPCEAVVRLVVSVVLAINAGAQVTPSGTLCLLNPSGVLFGAPEPHEVPCHFQNWPSLTRVCILSTCQLSRCDPRRRKASRKI